MNNRFLLRILLNALYIYISVLVSCAAYIFVSGAQVGPEFWAFFSSLDAPISTASILIFIYTLSILDKSILKPLFIILAAAFSEVITLFTGIIFFANLAAIITLFIVWTLIRKFFFSNKASGTMYD